MRKKRSGVHTPNSICEKEQKKPKIGNESAEVCHFQAEKFVGEYCTVHTRPSLTVKALSFNSSIGRLCVIRQNESTVSQQFPSQLSLIEFYNADNLPLIFLEKSIPVNDRFETLVWVDNWAVFGGLGGRLTALSPFTSKFGRVQLCVSDILVMTRAGENHQFVAGNTSGELLVVNNRDFDEEGKCTNKVPTFSTVQTIKLSTDEHITAIGCSNNKTLTPQMMAVGKVNGLSLFLYESEWKKHKEIDIPRTKESANVVWSLIFVETFLFTGDSRGQLSIYDALNGTLLKTLKTHQAAVLTIATNGKEVFAAGADYRIQIVKRISHDNVRFEWQQSGQRLFHANDVRAICVLDKRLLVSGGSDSELFISDKFTHANPQIKSECAFFVSKSNCYVIVSHHLSHLDLWYKTIGGSLMDQRKRLKLFLRITSGKLGFIKQFCVSSDGKFLAFAGAVAGAIRVFRLHCDQITTFLATCAPEHIEDAQSSKLIKLIWSNDKGDEENGSKRTGHTGGRTVSAIHCTNKFLYFARGEFNLVRLDLQNKRLRTFASKVNGGHVTKICVDSADTRLVALTVAGTFCFDLTKLTHENGQMGEDGLISLELPQKAHPYDCVFYDKCKIVIIMADLNKHVIIYDLNSNSILFTIGNAELDLVSNEWVAYLHVNMRGTVVATTNKARLRLLSIEESKIRLFVDESAESNEHEIAKSSDSRIEPFWLEDRSDLSTNCLNSRFVLVKHVEENVSTRIPCHLRFFGKN